MENAVEKVVLPRGRDGGRPKKLKINKRKQVFELFESRIYTIKEICKRMKISAPTLYKYVREIMCEENKEVLISKTNRHKPRELIIGG